MYAGISEPKFLEKIATQLNHSINSFKNIVAHFCFVNSRGSEFGWGSSHNVWGMVDIQVLLYRHGHVEAVFDEYQSLILLGNRQDHPM